MDNKVGDHGFFERSFKGVHKAVGEAADEADGVGDEELLIAAQDELTGGGVEGSEEFVLGEDVGAGEGVEEGGFTGVGVADDGGGGDGHALAFVALDAALFLHDLEFAFETGDAVAHEAMVLLELGLAFAAHLAFAALAGEVSPGAGEAGERILHARESDLEDGLAGLRAVGEDVEDHLLSVDHGDRGEFFPIALLGGAEGLVEDDDVALEETGGADDLLHLAGADEGGGAGRAEVDEGVTDDGDAEVFDEFLELGEEFDGFAGGHLGCLDADEIGAFDAFRIGFEGVIEEVGQGRRPRGVRNDESLKTNGTELGGRCGVGAPRLHLGGSCGWGGVGLEPDGEGEFRHFAGGEGESAKDGVGFGGVETVTVDLKEENGDGVTDAFVTIDERVVFDEAEGVGGGEFKVIGPTVGPEVDGAGNRRVEHGFVAEAGGAAVLGEEEIMIREDDLAQHPSGLVHFASSRRVL